MAEKLGIPAQHLHANDLCFTPTGDYRGFDTDNPLCRSGGKGEVIMNLPRLPHTLFIGDGASDVEVGSNVELFVGYGGMEKRDAVHKAAPVYLHGESMAPLVVMAAGMEGCMKLLDDPTLSSARHQRLLDPDARREHRLPTGVRAVLPPHKQVLPGRKQLMQLRIPGPTPLPDEVLEAMNRNMISHRGAEFRAMMRDVTERLKHCFQTEGDVLVFPGAGTGGLEASIVNLFSPGDTVMALTVGAFGERYAEIAERFGLNVIRLASPWGEAADLDALARGAGRDAERQGRADDAQRDLHRRAKRCGESGGHPPKWEGKTPLLLVDAISSLGAVDIGVDRWGIDVIVTGSQKAWMAPPGLTMLSVSERAWEASRRARLPRFYWDFAEAKRFLDRDETHIPRRYPSSSGCKPRYTL